MEQGWGEQRRHRVEGVECEPEPGGGGGGGGEVIGGINMWGIKGHQELQ